MFLKAKKSQEPFDHFKHCLHGGMIPSFRWIKRLPKDWLKHHCTSAARCKQAHAFLLRTALFDDNLYTSKLLSFLALSPHPGDLRYALRLFTHLHRPDSFIWNTVIRGLARGPAPSVALSFYRLMLTSDVAPDHYTYPFVLTACARLPSAETGMLFHTVTLKLGLHSDVFVLNSLIQLYASCGYFGSARKLFDGNPMRDVVSWNVMIRGYVHGGLFQQAFDWFEEMVRAVDVELDDVTMISLASACSQLGDLDRGRSLHSYSKELGLVANNLRLSNAFLDMYCKCGDLVSAQEIFDEMGERDVLTWTSMISGLANSGSLQESLQLFGQMQRKGIRLDEVVLVTMLSVCAQMGALDQGKYIHLLMGRDKVKRDVVLETALVDMYAKCGSLDFALQVFQRMKERNVYTWNAMIGGMAMHGHGGHALEIFESMRHQNIVPDDVTFIGLLSACRHEGLVDEGLRFFRQMKEVYQIQPRMEHYGCVVDLLCRAQLVQDALAFIESMPIRPNVILWASLLGACKSYGDAELAKRVGERVIGLEPDACGRYVTLSNLYAGAHQWDDALEVRNLMKAKGIEKSPGASWIEVNGTVHQFVAGDRLHPETDGIYMMVEEMCQRVISAGHVAVTLEVLFNIEEEEKERSLFLHSEKLAVAFGLMSTAPGSPIRITKNLRVCNDCHSFLKAVSMVFSREIVARDRSRFHHFREGMCSCNDFW